MSEPSYRNKLREVFGLIAIASVCTAAMVGIFGRHSKPVSPPIEPPTGFVEITQERAIEVAQSLPSCFVKQDAFDGRAGGREGDIAYTAGGKIELSRTAISSAAEALTLLSGGGVNGFAPTSKECGRLTTSMLHLSSAGPNYVFSLNGENAKVELLEAKGKIYMPKPR